MDNSTKIKRILYVEDELKNPHSIFYTYKRLIQYRKQYDVFGDGKYNLLEKDHTQIFAYERVMDHQQLLVISNFTSAYAHMIYQKIIKTEFARF